VLNPLVVKDRLLRAGSKKASPKWKKGKKFMSRRPGRGMQKVYIGHLRWLQDQGPSYKQQAASCKRQAASCKRQAASLTRDLYNVIGVYRRNYESKRSN
jgi:hypothetical protein